MRVLRYDGSFGDLIRVLEPWLAAGALPDAIDRAGERQPTLFGDGDAADASVPARQSNTEDAHDPAGLPVAIGVTTALVQIEHAHSDDEDGLHPRVHVAVSGRPLRIVPHSWQTAWLAFLADTPDVAMRVARYLALAQEAGAAVDDRLADPRVIAVHGLRRRVLREADKLRGLLRFRQLGTNLYYASLHPDCFVLPLLAPWFAKRLGDQDWIIHDQRREIAAVYDRRTWALVPRAAAPMPPADARESAMQTLWRRFFDSIAVRERINLALQQHHVPKKYRIDLPEFDGRG